MKVLRIIGLGLIIWALSLWWPDLNRLLTDARMTKSIIGLGGIILIYLIDHYLDRTYDHSDSGQSQTAGQTFVLYTFC